MKHWLQKLFQLFGVRKTFKDDGVEFNEEQFEYKHSRSIPEANVRVKTVYPRRHSGETPRFRFPLIPDEQQNDFSQLRTSSVQTSSSRREVEVRQHFRYEKRSFNDSEKKRFTPSEFYSPVYGSIRPELKKDEDFIETNTRSSDVPMKKKTIDDINNNVLDFRSIAPESRGEGLDLRDSANKERGAMDPSETNVNDTLTTKESDAVHSSSIKQTDDLDKRTYTGGAVIPFPKSSMTSDATIAYKQPTISEEPSSPLDLKMESSYQFPPLHLLNEEPLRDDDDQQSVQKQIDRLTDALESFNVKADVVGVAKGPTVTRFELQPGPGVKVNKFTNLIDDIKLALAAKDIRMEAPIPGRSAIGVEVPNEVSSPVFLRSLLESRSFQDHESPLAVALGRDIGGEAVIGDLRKMPHGLIAGSTGSGKSVCINSILVSLLYKATPSELRMILIDPKVVELAPYNHIPHLLTPVVTDPKQATAALRWAVEEMEQRYEKFAEQGARDIERYNSMVQREGGEKLPYILIVIDELADLMMVAPQEVEESICRIAQKARACGIHLLIATQRPSVDVITGLIKANIPTRIAFAVSSQADSRTILDMSGAERLLGKGDMLYYPSGLPKPARLQGNFVSDEEIDRVVAHVKSQQETNYIIDKEELNRESNRAGGDFEDELFSEALLFTIQQGQASSSSLQRKFRIGYNRAARLIDMMESAGFVGGQSGSRPREVLITMEEYDRIFNQ